MNTEIVINFLQENWILIVLGTVIVGKILWDEIKKRKKTINWDKKRKEIKTIKEEPINLDDLFNTEKNIKENKLVSGKNIGENILRTVKLMREKDVELESEMVKDLEDAKEELSKVKMTSEEILTYGKELGLLYHKYQLREEQLNTKISVLKQTNNNPQKTL